MKIGLKLPPALNPTEGLALAVLTKNGDKRARDQLILGHMGMAVSITMNYLLSARTRSRVDDLLSAAFYGVCDAVRLISEGHLTHDNVSGYIAMRVNGEIRDSTSKSVVHGCEIPDSELKDDIGSFKGDRHYRKGELIKENNCPLVKCELPRLDTSWEIEDEIEKLAKDKTDERIIRMLLLGYSQTEIAEELGFTKGLISQRLSRIRSSYEQS